MKQALLELRFRLQAYFWTPVEYFCNPYALYIVFNNISHYEKTRPNRGAAVLSLHPLLIILSIYYISILRYESTSTLEKLLSGEPFESESVKLPDFDESGELITTSQYIADPLFRGYTEMQSQIEEIPPFPTTVTPDARRNGPHTGRFYPSTAEELEMKTFLDEETKALVAEEYTDYIADGEAFYDDLSDEEYDVILHDSFKRRAAAQKRRDQKKKSGESPAMEKTSTITIVTSDLDPLSSEPGGDTRGTAFRILGNIIDNEDRPIEPEEPSKEKTTGPGKKSMEPEKINGEEDLCYIEDEEHELLQEFPKLKKYFIPVEIVKKKKDTETQDTSHMKYEDTSHMKYEDTSHMKYEDTSHMKYEDSGGQDEAIDQTMLQKNLPLPFTTRLVPISEPRSPKTKHKTRPYGQTHSKKASTVKGKKFLIENQGKKNSKNETLAADYEKQPMDTAQIFRVLNIYQQDWPNPQQYWQAGKSGMPSSTKETRSKAHAGWEHGKKKRIQNVQKMEEHIKKLEQFYESQKKEEGLAAEDYAKKHAHKVAKKESNQQFIETMNRFKKAGITNLRYTTNSYRSTAYQRTFPSLQQVGQVIPKSKAFFKKGDKKKGKQTLSSSIVSDEVLEQVSNPYYPQMENKFRDQIDTIDKLEYLDEPEEPPIAPNPWSRIRFPKKQYKPTNDGTIFGPFGAQKSQWNERHAPYSVDTLQLSEGREHGLSFPFDIAGRKARLAYTSSPFSAYDENETLFPNRTKVKILQDEDSDLVDTSHMKYADTSHMKYADTSHMKYADTSHMKYEEANEKIQGSESELINDFLDVNRDLHDIDLTQIGPLTEESALVLEEDDESDDEQNFTENSTGNFQNSSEQEINFGDEFGADFEALFEDDMFSLKNEEPEFENVKPAKKEKKGGRSRPTDEAKARAKRGQDPDEEVDRSGMLGDDDTEEGTDVEESTIKSEVGEAMPLKETYIFLTEQGEKHLRLYKEWEQRLFKRYASIQNTKAHTKLSKGLQTELEQKEAELKVVLDTSTSPLDMMLLSLQYSSGEIKLQQFVNSPLYTAFATFSGTKPLSLYENVHILTRDSQALRSDLDILPHISYEKYPSDRASETADSGKDMNLLMTPLVLQKAEGPVMGGHTKTPQTFFVEVLDSPCSTLVDTDLATPFFQHEKLDVKAKSHERDQLEKAVDTSHMKYEDTSHMKYEDTSHMKYEDLDDVNAIDSARASDMWFEDSNLSTLLEMRLQRENFVNTTDLKLDAQILQDMKRKVERAKIRRIEEEVATRVQAKIDNFELGDKTSEQVAAEFRKAFTEDFDGTFGLMDQSKVETIVEEKIIALHQPRQNSAVLKTYYQDNPLFEDNQSVLSSGQRFWDATRFSLSQEEYSLAQIRSPFLFMAWAFFTIITMTFFRIRQSLFNLLESIEQEEDPKNKKPRIKGSVFKLVFPTQLFPGIFSFTGIRSRQTFLMHLQPFKALNMNRSFFRLISLFLVQVYAWSQLPVFVGAGVVIFLWSFRGAGLTMKKMPRGYILTGVPGSGKSVFFQALLRETGACGIQAKVTEPQGVKQILRDSLFFRPCVILLDYLDKVAVRREESIQTKTPYASIVAHQKKIRDMEHFHKKFVEAMAQQRMADDTSRMKYEENQSSDAVQSSSSESTESQFVSSDSSQFAGVESKGAESLQEATDGTYLSQSEGVQSSSSEATDGTTQAVKVDSEVNQAIDFLQQRTRSSYLSRLSKVSLKARKSGYRKIFLDTRDSRNRVLENYEDTAYKQRFFDLPLSGPAVIGPKHVDNLKQMREAYSTAESFEPASLYIKPSVVSEDLFVSKQRLSMDAVTLEKKPNERVKTDFETGNIPLTIPIIENTFKRVYLSILEALTESEPEEKEEKKDEGGGNPHAGTLLSLLVYLDSSTDGNILMASTWSISRLDKALIRPGRFDTVITFNFPEKYERIRILELNATKQPFPAVSPDLSWDFFATLTRSFTAADLTLLIETSYREVCKRQTTALKKEHTMGTLIYALKVHTKQLKLLKRD